MGNYTSIISNHSLNNNSIEELAQDISIRLQANVVYGYNYCFFVKDNTIEYDIEFIETGKIIFATSKVEYQLCDQNLGQKLFVEATGKDNITSNKYLIDSYLKEMLLDNEENYEVELILDDETICYIYKYGLDFWVIDSIYWYKFQRYFIYNINEEDLQDFNNWRTEHKNWIEKLGGNVMFVYCFNEKSYKISEWLEIQSLENSISLIEKEFKNQLVNVSKYLRSKIYLNLPVYEQLPISKNYLKKISLEIEEGKNDDKEILYPILFYDDFYDLDIKTRGNNIFLDVKYDVKNVLKKILKQEQLDNNYVVERKIFKPIDLTNYFKIYSGYIAGFKYYTDIDFEVHLQINQELFLVCEPDNEYDSYAVAIYINHQSKDQKSFSRKIGYIAKGDNYILYKLLKNNYTLKSQLSKINEEKLDSEQYNSTLKIEVFLEKK